jgi:hypothetical protein
MPEAPPREPATLRFAVWMLAGETVVLLAVLVFLLYQDVTGAADTAQGAAAVTLYTALFVVVLGGLAWALHRRRRWARGPAIVVQMLLIPIGFTMAASGLPALGVPVLVIGLVGAGTLLAPATREAMGRN